MSFISYQFYIIVCFPVLQLKEYHANLLERDTLIECLTSELKKKNNEADLKEATIDNLLKKVKLLDQQLSRLTASLQSTASHEPVSPQAFKALQDEVRSYKHYQFFFIIIIIINSQLVLREHSSIGHITIVHRRMVDIMVYR